MTIGKREGVLGRGLGERSEEVRMVVEKEMTSPQLWTIKLSHSSVGKTKFCSKVLVTINKTGKRYQAGVQDPSVTQLNATLLTWLQVFVIVSVQYELSAIMREAIMAMACCCAASGPSRMRGRSWTSATSSSGLRLLKASASCS